MANIASITIASFLSIVFSLRANMNNMNEDRNVAIISTIPNPVSTTLP